MNTPIHVDTNGVDISAFMTPVPACEYDAAGRIIGGVTQALAYTQDMIRAGRRMVEGDGLYDFMTDQSPRYVVVENGAPLIRARPLLTQTFDRSTIKVGEEAILLDVPACQVEIVGPWRGEHEHPGGELHVGFSVPGTYAISFEAFPYMPVTHTLTVEAQS